MSGAVRAPIDVSTGHGCFPPKNNVSGSTNVLVNGEQSFRLEDPWETHCCGPACHDSVQSLGSPTVLVNGKPKARIGDDISCGGKTNSGSSNVLVN